MASDVDRRLRTVLATMLHIPDTEITPALSSETLEQWDSIAHMNIMLALEDAFGVNFSDAEIMDHRSYRALSTLIAKKQTV
jgi:acyl carrier protein